jgi:hypothetical protein
MKNYTFYFFVVLLAGMFFFVSCTEEKATTGSLTVVAMDSTGSYVPNIQINLAKSVDELKNHTYITKDWTNEKGAVIFHDLLPGYYWFSTDGWDDYGSARVFTGIDHYVVLWLNNPEGKK